MGHAPEPKPPEKVETARWVKGSPDGRSVMRCLRMTVKKTLTPFALKPAAVRALLAINGRRPDLLEELADPALCLELESCGLVQQTAARWSKRHGYGTPPVRRVRLTLKGKRRLKDAGLLPGKCRPACGHDLGDRR